MLLGKCLFVSSHGVLWVWVFIFGVFFFKSMAILLVVKVDRCTADVLSLKQNFSTQFCHCMLEVNYFASVSPILLSRGY